MRMHTDLGGTLSSVIMLVCNIYKFLNPGAGDNAVPEDGDFA